MLIVNYISKCIYCSKKIIIFNLTFIIFQSSYSSSIINYNLITLKSNHLSGTTIMNSLLQKLKSLIKIEEVCINNHVFRLHYKATVIILIVCMLMNIYRQYIGDPISCASKVMPKETMDIYCWILLKETYPIVKLNSADKGRLKHHKYYQWVCFILFFQAILFYIPHYVWKVWGGGRVKKLVCDLKLKSLDEPTLNERCNSVGEYFVRNINDHTPYLFRFFFCEILNLLNVFNQMFIMNWFLGNEFTTYGWRVLTFIETEQRDRIDPMANIFPKLAACGDGFCIFPVNVL